MLYREFEVPAPLSRHVRCVWEWSDPSPADAVQTIYPDGCCELIVHLATPPLRLGVRSGWQPQAATLFAAQQIEAIRLRAQAGSAVHCIGIRLQPEASAALAGAQLPALREQIIDLTGLDAPFAGALCAAVDSMRLSDGGPAPLWPLLTTRMAATQLDPVVVQAVALLQQTDGSLRLETLASQLGLSARTLQTRFLAQVGLRTKEFARLLRLQALLRQLDCGVDEPLAQLALDRGFADQAHATRELRRITGQTPARLLAALRDQRDGEETVRLAAAFVRGFGSTTSKRA